MVLYAIIITAQVKGHTVHSVHLNDRNQKPNGKKAKRTIANAMQTNKFGQRSSRIKKGKQVKEKRRDEDASMCLMVH